MLHIYIYIYMYMLNLYYTYIIDENGMFASVAFKTKKKDIPKNIDLYDASNSKYYFNDLKVSNPCTYL